MTFKQRADAVEVVNRERLTRKVHIGDVEIELADALVPAGASPLPKHTAKTNQSGHDQGQDEARQRGTAAAPKPEPFERRGLAGGDRLSFGETAEVFSEFTRRVVTPCRLFGQCLQADHFQVARDGEIRRPKPKGRSPP